MQSKKSIFYTGAAIVLTIVIMASYSAYSTYRLNDKMDVVSGRIDTVNFFIKDVEKDLGKGVYIAGFRTLIGFNQYISTNGTFIDDVNARFKESFLNGTINRQPVALMKGTTFTDWANRISAESNKVDISLNFTISGVRINHTDPWNIDIGVNMTLTIQDKKNTSSWIRNREVSSRISITGFEDPLYVVNSGGRVTNTIVQSNITNFVVNADTSNLMMHANNSWYKANNASPSFLMRFQGDTGNSTFGIESLVNLAEFQAQNVNIKDRSIVDSVYFSTKQTTNYRINQTPEWFKLDQGHLAFYQAQNSTI